MPVVSGGERHKALNSKGQIELLVPVGTIVLLGVDVLGWQEEQIAVMLNKRP